MEAYKEFEVIKGSSTVVKFKVNTEQLGEYDKLLIRYKIGNEINKHSEDGFFKANNILPERNAISLLSSVVVEGRKCNGFVIPENNMRELVILRKNLIAKTREAEEEEKRKIRIGEKKIKITYHDGEYLSGYCVFGYEAILLTDLRLAKEISGWGTKVKNEVAEKLGNEFTYPEAEKLAKSLPELNKLRMDEQEKELQKRQAREKKVKRKAELMSNILEVQYDSFEESDEGGKTTAYKSTVIFENETFMFNDRNIFDFGRVINPCYAIQDGIEIGGLMRKNKEEDKYYWQTFKTAEGWFDVREVTGHELQAYLLILEFGKLVNSSIRM